MLSVFMLHAAISLFMTLGPFSYSMMAFALLLLGPDDWAFIARVFSSKRRLLVAYDAASAIHHRLARVVARLDARRALEFADVRDADNIALAADMPEQREPFEVWRRSAASATGAEERPGVTRLTGSEGAAAVVALLPLSVLYAWLLRTPPLSQWVDRLLRTPDPHRGAFDEAYVETPATQFKQRVLRAMGEILAAGFLLTVVTQIAVDNWAIPDRYRVKRRPELQRQLVEYLRVPQGWSMFSPDAPKEDGTITIDAVLSDGTHIDPRKQRPPDFEPALHGPWFDDQQWCDWDLRMRFDGNRHLHPHFRDYIARLDKFRSWKQRATIVYFDVYWVNNAAPPPGSTLPYNITKQLLFSGGIHP
jgi:predicted DCC family thiol-disulfide oxidoreductase YuxK